MGRFGWVLWRAVARVDGERAEEVVVVVVGGVIM